ncbi:uncharacterized protein FFE2_13177 [Fusarium fujikuroi]
MLIFN